MALWAKVQQLPQQFMSQVQGNYNIHFPMIVRHHFAQWIEDQPWKDIDDTNPQHVQYADQLLGQLIALIEAKTNDNSLDFLTRSSLQSFAVQFKNAYSTLPMNLVQVVCNCLANEEKLIRASETPSPPSVNSVPAQIDEKKKQEMKGYMDLLDKRTDETNNDLRHTRLSQEQFVIDHQNQTQLSASLTYVQKMPPSASRNDKETKLKQGKDEIDRKLLASAQQIRLQRLALATKHRDTLTTLESITKRIVGNELVAWKQNQKMSLNGAPFDTTMIDVLQKWCESLADLIWRNRMQINDVDFLRQQLPILVSTDGTNGVVDLQPELNNTVNALLKLLVTNAFVVEHQPPQVLKKQTGFATTVRSLIGGNLSLHLNPPIVKAIILSELETRNVVENGFGVVTQEQGNALLNNKQKMDYHKQTGQLCATFSNMSIQKIKRADRKRNDKVAEEKSCICFYSNFEIGGNAVNCHVWTMSLPVVPTVHGNQECMASATCLWDNQFSEPGRIPFQVSNIATWPEVANMLSTKFYLMTGGPLTESNLKYLGTKLPRTNDTADNVGVVYWDQFSKEGFPGKKFTFWEWFWAIAKLVRDHLKGPWTDKLIIGFMDKMESNELLLSRPIGTFLLRFSDSTEGGITIAYVKENPDKPGEKQIWNLAPFTTNELTQRGLADRIKDLTSLVALYPDTPKQTAFQSYISKPTSDVTPNMTQEGYIKTKLITVIDEQPSTQEEIDLNNIHSRGACAGDISCPPYPDQPGTLDTTQVPGTMTM